MLRYHAFGRISRIGAARGVTRAIGFLLGILLGPGSAHAQSWNAEAMLREPASQTVIVLRTGSGQTLAEVSRAQLERSGEVLQRLAKAYGMAAPELYVTASNAPNASASTRGGRPAVSITTGMLRLAGDRDDYLAAILGHELGHLQAGHATVRRERSELVTTFGVIVGAVVDIGLGWRGYSTGGAGVELGGMGANLVKAKFSRDQEREADRLGAEAMAKAGYDPAGAVGLWRALGSAAPAAEGFWLNTHPPHAEREAELADRARKLAPVFAANQAAGATTSAVRETVILGTPLVPAAQMQAAPTRSAPAPIAPAIRVTIPNADAGALGQLAFQHMTGSNRMPRDHAKARAFGEHAAQAGDPVGKAVYGTMLRDGIAGGADVFLGTQLLKEAADDGVAWAHYQMGVAYRGGLGVPIDRQSAIRHLSAAAPTVIEAQELLSRIKSESQ